METASAPAAPIRVDALLYPRWLLPMTGAGVLFTQYGLAIGDNRIVAIAPASELAARYQAVREYRLDSHVVMPGFVNAHGHSPMSLLRGFADDLPLQPWLEQRIWPAEARWLGEGYAADGARLAIAEMLLGGTTCFTDMYFFADQIGAAAAEAGIRARLASPVFEFPTAWAEKPRDYINKATRLRDDFRYTDLVDIMFGPHAPYTVSNDTLRELIVQANELDMGIHMHMHENAQEIRDAMQATGFRPLTRMKHLDLLDPRVQFVHMTQLLDDEIVLLAAHGVHVVHCPSSNMKLASGFCRTADLLAAGVNVALGTDSCASNNRLDMFGELRLAALLAKGTSGDAAAVPAYQALQMATLNGARALGMEDAIGSLEAGKLADLIAVDLDRPNTQPVYDPVSTLVYSATAAQVSHVWVNGQLLVDERRLTRMNETRLLQLAKEWGGRIGERIDA